MDTMDTGRASKFRLSERQVGWRLPYPRRGGRPPISGPRFIVPTWSEVVVDLSSNEKKKKLPDTQGAGGRLKVLWGIVGERYNYNKH